MTSVFPKPLQDASPNNHPCPCNWMLDSSAQAKIHAKIFRWRSQIATAIHEKVPEIKVGTVVLGLATAHDRKSESAGTFSRPCCLVLVGQDRQSIMGSWPPAVSKSKWIPNREVHQTKKKCIVYSDIPHTHTHTHTHTCHATLLSVLLHLRARTHTHTPMTCYGAVRFLTHTHTHARFPDVVLQVHTYVMPSFLWVFLHLHAHTHTPTHVMLRCCPFSSAYTLVMMMMMMMMNMLMKLKFRFCLFQFPFSKVWKVTAAASLSETRHQVFLDLTSPKYTHLSFHVHHYKHPWIHACSSLFRKPSNLNLQFIRLPSPCPGSIVPPFS